MSLVKKILIKIFAALLCVSAVMFAFACQDSGANEKYSLTVNNDSAKGTITLSLNDTSYAKGTVIKLTVSPKEEYELDGIIINGKNAEINENSADITIEKDTIVDVVYKERPAEDTVTILWEEDEAVEFVFETFAPGKVKRGTVVSFSVRISPYYVGTAKVMAGNEELTKGEDGKYSFAANSSLSVYVKGLKNASSKIEGLGTEKNPYKISNAAQLKAFTDSINAGKDKYSEAFVELTEDISFGGELLEPIGTSNHIFKGQFNGNGHVVSDFKMQPVDGITGFFGYIATASVINLNVKTNYSIEGNGAFNYILGGIVAYNIGSDVVNCSFEGDIVVRNEYKDGTVYLGGICGFMQGYAPEYVADLSFCTYKGKISSEGSYPLYAEGGIVGGLLGTAYSATASVYNCSFEGSVVGFTERAGGIVGYLRDTASIANCIVSGNIEAASKGANTYAGAITGTADNETSISRCVASATLKSAWGSESDKIGKKDDMAGVVRKEDAFEIDAKESLLLDNYYTNSGVFSENGNTFGINDLEKIVNLLGWHSEDWKTVDGVIRPEYLETVSQNIKARFVFGKEVTRPGKDGKDLTLTEETVTFTSCLPVYAIWDGNGMNNFAADDRSVSYGYFLDEELTQRIPAAFLVTNDINIYVGFMSYKPVEGEYYAVFNINKDNTKTQTEIKLVFDDFGKMTMYCDGMVASYMYVFDGKRITIHDAYFAYIAYPELKKYSIPTDYYATIEENDEIHIYNPQLSSITEELDFYVYRKNAVMGTWYDNDGAVYRFLADGRGSITSVNGGLQEFTYRTSGRFTITLGNTDYYLTVDGDSMYSDNGEISVTRYDIFTGAWESSFGTIKTIDFDGKGKVVYGTESYDYTITGGVAEFAGVTATFNERGLLVITDNGVSVEFGREGSYIGTWTETYLDYTFILYGIDKDGYGSGRDNHGIEFSYVADVYYDEKGKKEIMVNMFYRTSFYGMFSATDIEEDKGTGKILALAAYYWQTGMIVDDYNMCYVDPMKGVWNSADGTSYEFNGLGSYNISYTTSEGKDWIAKGTVTVKKDGNSQTVRYNYYYDGRATFAVDGTEYVALLSGEDIIVNGSVYKMPDEVSEYKYHLGAAVVEFNGKSPVGLGKATVTENGKSEVYDYVYVENGDVATAELTENGMLVYKFIFKDGAVTVSKNGVGIKDVGLYHRVVGNEYLIGGDKTFKTNSAMDIKGKTTGVFAGVEVDVYYVDQTYVSVYADTTFLYYVGYLKDNVVVLLDSSMKTVGVLTVADDLKGVYKGKDGSKVVFDGRSYGSDYIYAIMTLTVIEDFGDGEEEFAEDYAYKEENGEYFAYVIDKSGEETVLKKAYRISFTEAENATAFTNDSGRTVYLIETSD